MRLVLVTGTGQALGGNRWRTQTSWEGFKAGPQTWEPARVVELPGGSHYNPWAWRARGGWPSGAQASWNSGRGFLKGVGDRTSFRLLSGLQVIKLNQKPEAVRAHLFSL